MSIKVNDYVVHTKYNHSKTNKKETFGKVAKIYEESKQCALMVKTSKPWEHLDFMVVKVPVSSIRLATPETDPEYFL